MDLQEFTLTISAGNNLTYDQAFQVAGLMTQSEVPQDEKAAFLTQLAQKGEVSDEVAGFAACFRELARNPGLEKWQASAIDVCGTGGDKQGTFNISTTTTFVLSAAGVPVFKHGNRSITSKCGSSNLLEAIGVKIDADDATLRKSMEELGFCFMFAPAFHPAFKEIMPVRQALAAKGQRSIFNILGPLINPAHPAYQLLGVFSPSIIEVMAGALEKVGLKSGVIAHCDLGESGGMDEFSVAGGNLAKGIGKLRSFPGTWDVEKFKIEPGKLSELEGGDVAVNLQILDSLLAGNAPKALQDTVALNAGIALYIAEKCSSVEDGFATATDLLLGGEVRAKISDTKEFYSSI
ncbi:anthranilate phosphoribosyltransferase [Puniceicoccaceae bacterium K14]|nr:anthranilate phosphoribosyltransferase [Puniceicoccaceae bacterium K14]